MDKGYAIRGRREWGFVLVCGVLALAITSVPYVLGATLATESRIFGGFVYALEDCYSYLAKMRQGAEGAWLFHIAYTAEPHIGTLFFPFHLLLGKIAALLPGGDLSLRMVWVYHIARWIFGLGLLLTVYRFIAEFTAHVAVRRLAWLMVTFGGGLGWLLVALGRPGWLGSEPLDFILPEGFTFLVLYAFPHIALARTLLLWGILLLLRAWDYHTTCHLSFAHLSFIRPYSVLAGLAWLVMGLIVPFYVIVAWAVTGAAWLALGIRNRRALWHKAAQAGIGAVISSPIVIYSAWVFKTQPVYAVWAAQNMILSPHPLHYLAAYGIPLVLAAFSLREAWRAERPLWLAIAWVGVVPLLVYLPFNPQRRLVEGVQVPLSLLAAMGLWRIANLQVGKSGPLSRISNFRSGLVMVVGIAVLVPTNIVLVAGNCRALRGLPAPIYRDAGEIAALDGLHKEAGPTDVVLSAYETGNYLPARVWARSFLGHGPETVHFAEKKRLVARFFDAATSDSWRYGLLDYYGVDYIFWGPAERALGGFDPYTASHYLRPVYEADEYSIFKFVQQGTR